MPTSQVWFTLSKSLFFHSSSFAFDMNWMFVPLPASLLELEEWSVLRHTTDPTTELDMFRPKP